MRKFTSSVRLVAIGCYFFSILLNDDDNDNAPARLEEKARGVHNVICEREVTEPALFSLQTLFQSMNKLDLGHI
jgi:hypothetical protein